MSHETCALSSDVPAYHGDEADDYDDGACLSCGAGSDEHCNDDCDCYDCENTEEFWRGYQDREGFCE